MCLQVVGIFPYTLTEKDTRCSYKYSLRLCLWGIFVQLVIFSFNCLFIKVLITSFEKTDLGSLIYIVSVCSFDMSMIILMVFLRKDSKKLADSLKELSTILSRSERAEHRPIAFGIMVISSGIITVPFATYYFGASTIIEVVYIALGSTLSSLTGMSMELYRLIIRLLARHLRLVTQNTIEIFAELSSSSTHPVKEVFSPIERNIKLFNALHYMEWKTGKVSFNIYKFTYITTGCLKSLAQ